MAREDQINWIYFWLLFYNSSNYHLLLRIWSHNNTTVDVIHIIVCQPLFNFVLDTIFYFQVHKSLIYWFLYMYVSIPCTNVRFTGSLLDMDITAWHWGHGQFICTLYMNCNMCDLIKMFELNWIEFPLWGLGCIINT